LLAFGARESSFFQQRLPTYAAITAALSRIAESLEMLQDSKQPDPTYREAMGQLFGEWIEATAAAFHALAKDDFPRALECFARMKSALTEIDARIGELRKRQVLALTIPAEHALDLGGWMLAIEEIGGALVSLHDLLLSVPTATMRSKEPLENQPPPLDPFWIRNGIRTGLAVAIGLFIQNWVQPPGGAMVTLAIFVFSALTRLYPGGEGDRRAFHYVAFTGLLGLLYVPAMLVLTPLMADYFVFNTLLLASLFLFGLFTFGVAGMGFVTQVFLLTIIGTAGLNAQEPVSFQSILGVYLGILIGLVISALVQRLLWPVLPQWQLRDRLLEWMDHCRALISNGPTERWRFLRLALLPGEVGAWISVMNKADCPPGEQTRLREAAGSLSRLSAYLTGWDSSVERDLPCGDAKALDSARKKLQSAICSGLEIPEAILNQKLPPQVEDLESARREWMERAAAVRREMLQEETPYEISVRILGRLDRKRRAAEELQNTIRAFQKLSPNLYLGDAIL
jgi:uncharacterized membrane protein YccC